MLLKLSRWLVPLITLAAFGCQQPVKWTVKSKLDPDPIKIGKKCIATCTVTGDLSQVGWVSAVPIIAPEYSLEMKDDGKADDAKADDGIYTYAAVAPDEAEPGMYEIEFIVYDKNGDPLQVPCFTILEKDGKTVQKEVKPTEEDGKVPETVEFSAIVTVTIE